MVADTPAILTATVNRSRWGHLTLESSTHLTLCNYVTRNVVKHLAKPLCSRCKRAATDLGIDVRGI